MTTSGRWAGVRIICLQQFARKMRVNGVNVPVQPCPVCGRYPNRPVTADAVVIRDGRVLLIRRGNEPFKGRYALPGGFVDQGETPEACAVRELEEETGLTGTPAGVINFYDDVSRDTARHSIGFAYIVDVPREQVAKAGDDAAAVEWWPLDALPSLAFDHDTILADVRDGTTLRRVKIDEGRSPNSM